MNKVLALAVDDDPDVLEMLSMGLSIAGFEVVTAANGAEAQKILDSRPDVSVMLTDFQMPHVDGPELLAWCREKGLHFPVVLLSSKFALQPEEKLALCDCCAFLLYKPFDFNALSGVVKAALERHHETQCVRPTNTSY